MSCSNSILLMLRLNSQHATLNTSQPRLDGTPTDSERPDYVLDCIDDVPTKADLMAACHRLELKLISSLGAGAKSDPTRVLMGTMKGPVKNDKLAPRIRQELRRRLPKDELRDIDDDDLSEERAAKLNSKERKKLKRRKKASGDPLAWLENITVVYSSQKPVAELKVGVVLQVCVQVCDR